MDEFHLKKMYCKMCKNYLIMESIEENSRKGYNFRDVMSFLIVKLNINVSEKNYDRTITRKSKRDTPKK